MATDMPLICETCLGGNPYIRMEKMGRAKLCNVTQLPYQGYRWRPANGRYKETVISSEVARSRNICQCCLNDLQFGLPVGVRDAMISVHSKQIAAPDSYVGSMVHYTQPQLAYSDGVTFADHVQNIVPTTQLDNFARKKYETQTNTQTAFRNLPKLCSFWLGGLCRRGDRCPFRPCNGTFVFPEIASDKEMHANLIALLNEKGAAALQVTLDKDIKTALKNALKGNSAESIRKRVRGNDDLTKKTLARVEDMKGSAAPPEDESVRTLWVGLVPEQATEQDLFNVAYVYGTVVSVKISRPSASAFIEFSTRSEAENAILHLSLGVSIVGCVLPVRWAKPQRPQIGAAVNQGPYGFDMPPPPGLDYAPLLHGSVETTDGMHEQKRSRIVQPSTMVYPSMDPNRLGST